ncbi:MAG: AAA family ATPase, partial [Bifidobacteriaceae bacterium]|nr:AAA family ATPase [Bifidobacteriaceae bacterium]
MALRSLYLASTGGDSLKSAIALGLIDAWRGQVDRLAVFRPLVNRVDEPEPLCELLRSQATVALSWSEPLGATYQEAYANPTAAGAKILERYLAVAERSDLVIVLGSDLAGPAEASGLALDARIAADLSCPVVLVTDGLRQSPAAARTALAVAERTLAEYHASWVGAIINRCETGELATMRQQMATLPVLNMVVPENRQVSAPTVRAVMEAVDGQLVAGSNRLLDQEAALLTVGALEPEHMLSTVKNGALVITPGDRAEMLLALVAAHADSSFSSLAGVILSGDFQPSQAMMRLITGIDANLPIIRSPLNTMTTASRAAAVRGHLTLNTAAKNQAAIALVREHVDTAGLWQAVESFTPKVVTPQRFAYSLLERARHDPKHIVLPEGSDLRILQAAARLVAMSAAELTVIGVPEQVSALAQQHDLDLTGV